MCAVFESIRPEQIEALNLPAFDLEYEQEIYPNYQTPLLFKSEQGLEWRMVNFGMVPKWAEDKEIATKTYNARNETLHEKPSFRDAFLKCKFAVIPVSKFYEMKYINGKAQRWGVQRKDGRAFYVAALYEITKQQDQIIRSATMISLDANEHEMMKEFHEPRTDKRCVMIIPHERLDEWLSLQQAEISTFVQGFPVEEFECFYAPKSKKDSNRLQLDIFESLM